MNMMLSKIKAQTLVSDHSITRSEQAEIKQITDNIYMSQCAAYNSKGKPCLVKTFWYSTGITSPTRCSRKLPNTKTHLEIMLYNVAPPDKKSSLSDTHFLDFIDFWHIILVLVVAGLLGALFGCSDKGDYNDAKTEKKVYCEFVERWETDKANGVTKSMRSGWPPHREEIDCSKIDR